MAVAFRVAGNRYPSGNRSTGPRPAAVPLGFAEYQAAQRDAELAMVALPDRNVTGATVID
jgi:hypothetical protein